MNSGKIVAGRDGTGRDGWTGDIEGSTRGPRGPKNHSSLLSKDQTQHNHVGHVLEDVLRHRAPRPLDEHPDAHQDAVEKVLLHLEKENIQQDFFTKYRHLWKSPGATNESYQASLDVVVDN